MLTDAFIRKVKPLEKTKKYSDEKGMYLEVRPNGSMYWHMKYRFGGKENIFSMGGYPQVSLAEARIKRDAAKKQLLDGIDPNQAKRATQVEQAGENTFKHVAMEWYNKKSPAWSESNKTKVLARLNKDIFPFMGKSNIADIFAPELLKVIQRIEKRSVDTAYRALQECGQIFRYGQAIGKNTHDPSPALRGALEKRKQGHFAAITEPAKVGEMLRVILNI